MAKATPKLEQRKDAKTGVLKQSNVPILIDFSYNGTRLWIQTGLNIERNKWDEKKHRVKSNVVGSVEMNAIIEAKCEQINKIYREMVLANKQPTVSSLRNALSGNDKKDNKTLTQHYEDFIEEYKIKSSLSTVKKLKTNLKHLKDFSKTARINLEFDVIDNIFYNKYIQFFLVNKKHTNGTIARNVKVLKWFLNHAAKLGYNKNYAFKTFCYKSTEPEILALTKEELLLLEQFKTNNICLSQVRDCFLMLVYTTLRHSDGAALKKTDVISGFLNIVSQKTKSTLNIPIIDQTAKLIEKYKNCSGPYLMPFISNQKMNKYLKEVARLAGLNRMVTTTKYRGSQRIEEQFELHEVITTHMGRKSGISIMFNQGIDSELIRSISNHKSLSSFARYNKIDNQFKSMEMKKAFNPAI